MKPSFEEFHYALFYQHERTRLGIPLNPLQVRDLLADKRALTSYYRVWTPNFDPMKASTRLPVTAREKRMGALTGFVTVVFLTAGAAIIGAIIAAAQHTVLR